MPPRANWEKRWEIVEACLDQHGGRAYLEALHEALNREIGPVQKRTVREILHKFCLKGLLKKLPTLIDTRRMVYYKVQVFDAAYGKIMGVIS